MLAVTNDAGRVFTVRVVLKGEHYGLDDGLMHDAADPLVEFYDARHAGEERFGPRGQFVARYTLAALRVDRRAGLGLALNLGAPGWRVSATNVAEAIAYATGRAETVSSPAGGPRVVVDPACADGEADHAFDWIGGVGYCRRCDHERR